MQPHGLYHSSLLWPQNSPGRNTGVGCHALFQRSSQPRDRTQVSCITGRLFTIWTTQESRSTLSHLFKGWPYTQGITSQPCLSFCYPPHSFQPASSLPESCSIPLIKSTVCSFMLEKLLKTRKQRLVKLIWIWLWNPGASPGHSTDKAPVSNAGDPSLIPGSGRFHG